VQEKDFILLKDLCNNYKEDIVDGPFGANLKREHYQPEGVPVLKIQNIKPFNITLKKMDFVTTEKYEELKRHSYRSGDIIMTKLGDPLGESAIVDDIEGGLIVADLVRIRAQKIDTKYLCYHLNSPVTNSYINAQQKGTTRPRVRISVVRELPIYAPSIEEQKRIVAILDQAFADIDKARALTEQNLKNARELFESYLQKVFSQRGEGWVQTTLGEEIDLLTGFAFKSKEYVAHSDSIPLIRGDNIVQGKLRWEGVKLWPKTKISDYEKYLLAENDVVLAMDRTWVKAGMKYSRIAKEDLPALLVQRVARLRCLDDLNPDYLYHLVGSKLFERYVLSIQTGLGVPHISGKQIKDFGFSKPDIQDQHKIVGMLNLLADLTARLTEVYQRKLLSIDDLKKSLLQKAFSGELTNSSEEVAA